MYSRSICILFVASVLWFTSPCFGFDDPISVIGRIKWNYTTYEEHLWDAEYYKNTTIPLIYRQHIPFLLQTIGDGSASLIARNATDDIPFVSSVYNATIHVNQVWNTYANFSRWFSGKRIEAEVISAIDEIPGLEHAMDSLWNKTSTQIYFDFFRKVNEFYRIIYAATMIRRASVTCLSTFFFVLFLSLLFFSSPDDVG